MAALEQLSYRWVDNLLNTSPWQRLQVIDELNSIGQAEIEASTHACRANAEIKGLDYATKRLAALNKPTLLNRIFSASKAEMLGDLSIYRFDLEQMLKNCDDVLFTHEQHICRVQTMLRVALAIQKSQEKVHAMYYNASLNSWTPSDLNHLEFTIRQRIQTLTTHIAVLTQGQLANRIIRDNITMILQAIEQARNTHLLAKEVQENVREISKNDAFTLESWVAERRSSHPVIECFDERGDCYYREDGRGKHHLVSEAYTREKFGRSVPS